MMMMMEEKKKEEEEEKESVFLFCTTKFSLSKHSYYLYSSNSVHNYVLSTSNK
jgi:hypothetical protein